MTGVEGGVEVRLDLALEATHLPAFLGSKMGRREVYVKQITRFWWAALIAVTVATISCGSDDEAAVADGGIVNVDTPGGDGAAGAPGGGGAPGGNGGAGGTVGTPSDANSAGEVAAEGAEGATCTDGTSMPVKVCMTGLSCAAVQGAPGSDAGAGTLTCRTPCTPQGTCTTGVCCPAMAAGQTVFVCTAPGGCPGMN